MRLFGTFMLLCFFNCPLNAQGRSAEEALGESLVAAIAADDVVAYSQCWISSRRIVAMMKGIGIDLPADAPNDIREKHALRNKDIAESFRKIQSLIDSRKIDRQSIRLKECVALSVRERKAPNGTIKKAGRFNLVLIVNGEEWRFDINDGFVDNGVWYFSDSPVNLFAGDTILSFRDHRAKANKSLNRNGE